MELYSLLQEIEQSRKHREGTQNYILLNVRNVFGVFLFSFFPVRLFCLILFLQKKITLIGNIIGLKTL